MFIQSNEVRLTKKKKFIWLTSNINTTIITKLIEFLITSNVLKRRQILNTL